MTTVTAPDPIHEISVTLRINGQRRELHVDPWITLLDLA